MRRTTTTPRTATRRWLLAALTTGLTLSALAERADAQEILVTGPLAGAPAVRELRLYREGRFEISPAVTFTILDEYQRTILLGGRLNYNFTDWLALGAWGAVGSVIQIPTSLSDHIQEVNADRQATDPAGETLDRRLTAINLGQDFRDQLGGIDWIVAPQVTGIPFRGKLALFQGIYVDTDLYFFGGLGIIGLSERENCALPDKPCPQNFDMTSRVALAPSLGLGLSFYMGKWSALGFEFRSTPFSWNRSGFDVAGGGKDDAFPDNEISEADRQFSINPMLTVSLNFYLPTEPRVSE